MGKSLTAKIDAAERKYGKGPTYTPEERRLIVEKVVPEWLLRGRKLLTGELGERCANGVKALVSLHDAVWTKVADKPEVVSDA